MRFIAGRWVIHKAGKRLRKKKTAAIVASIVADVSCTCSVYLSYLSAVPKIDNNWHLGVMLLIQIETVLCREQISSADLLQLTISLILILESGELDFFH